MKPRFSILTLFSLTAYVAVNVIAFDRPIGYWTHVAILSAAAVLLYTLTVAAIPNGARSTFARGMLFAILLFSMLRTFEPATIASPQAESKPRLLSWEPKFNDGFLANGP